MSRARFEEAPAHRLSDDDRIGQYYPLAALAFHATTADRPKVAAAARRPETIRLGAEPPRWRGVCRSSCGGRRHGRAGKVEVPSQFEAKRLSRRARSGWRWRPAPGGVRADVGGGVLGAKARVTARLIADGEQQADRPGCSSGAHRRQSRPQHPQQARLQLTRSNRGLDRGGTSLAGQSSAVRFFTLDSSSSPPLSSRRRQVLVGRNPGGLRRSSFARRHRRSEAICLRRRQRCEVGAGRTPSPRAR